MNSALYTGNVRHRRFGQLSHRLNYPLFMLYIDLDEIDTAFERSWLWSARRPRPAWLRRQDYFGDPERPWTESVRDLVEERTGERPAGPVRLLTNPRTLGLRMNPISFFYCFDADEVLQAVVAEVTNTPWNESHLYVVDRSEAQLRPSPMDRGEASPRHSNVTWEAWLGKALHVSPFLPMDMEYRWVLAAPDRRLFFHMENHRRSWKAFDATLSLRRQEITPRSLRQVLLQHPLQTLRILFWIYLHAALLKVKGARFYPHPEATRGSVP